ncbi:hypothetical protein TNCV_4183101 [Trichonephila clavipes]|nr:hypothetical protein TNCV_4183101 [Trichonephila clavipes]
MSRCSDQVVSLKRNPQCLVPKQAWYSFFDPLKGWKVESTLPSPKRESRTCGVEARCATTRPLGLLHIALFDYLEVQFDLASSFHLHILIFEISLPTRLSYCLGLSLLTIYSLSNASDR